MNRERGVGGGGGGGSPRKEYDAPPPPISRADEVDDWGATKRNVPMSRETRGLSSSNSRYGDLGGGGSGGGGSRADENDNWSFGKKPAAVVGPTPTRSSNFGSGFGREQAGSDWRKGGDLGPTPRDEPVERRRLVLDPRSNNNNNEGNVVNNNAVNKENPFGAARPREEVLTGKGLDWKKLDSDYELKKVSAAGGGGSRPTSSQSNREENVVVGGGDGGKVKTRVKVNPFGDAKPREVLLEEKGLDWRKIDLQLEHRRFGPTLRR